MTRQVVTTDKAPKAIGPYSQAIKSGGFVFCSGQLAIDPKTGQMVTGTIADHTRQVLSNLKAVLESAGSSMDKVVKVTVFLKSIDDFSDMNAEYAKWFPKDPPARSAIQAGRLPRDAVIEIEAIATV